MIGSLHRSPTLPDSEDPFSVSTLCARAGASTRADELWPIRHPLGSRLSNEPADPFHLARFPGKPRLRTNNLLLCIDTNCMPLQEAGKLSAAISFGCPKKNIARRSLRSARRGDTALECCFAADRCNRRRHKFGYRVSRAKNARDAIPQNSPIWCCKSLSTEGTRLPESQKVNPGNPPGLMERKTGFEPATSSLARRCSTS